MARYSRHYSLTMLYTSWKVHKKLVFSPNVSTTLRRSSSVAVAQHSTSTDTYKYINNKLKEGGLGALVMSVMSGRKKTPRYSYKINSPTPMM